ncbi:MAG: TatA/E family twin arginine-targeting protein translocase [Desulfuromonadales bacterium]|nr:TatA/E family twin arginine-targeting protein translocase [Desulfuromonadales bacterium]
MFGIGMPELIIIFVIALIVIGPHKLPELAKSLGKGLAEFKKASEDFQRSVQEETRREETTASTAQQTPPTPTESQATSVEPQHASQEEKKDSSKA